MLTVAVANCWLPDPVEAKELPADSLVPLEISIENDSDIKDVPRFAVLTWDDTADTVAVLVKLELPARKARVFVVADGLDTLLDIIIAAAVLVWLVVWDVVEILARTVPNVTIPLIWDEELDPGAD